MLIYPAIDLVGGQAVRLVKGDYAQLTVYNPDPVSVARDFAACGATHMHMVDLEGARDGGTPNFAVIAAVKREAGLFCEVGGGVRDLETIGRYLSAGIDRVILGTSAVNDRAFLLAALSAFGEKIAVGADVRGGYVAVKGWTEKSAFTLNEFAAQMEKDGVRTLICTDVSKDGAMQGVNLAMYKELKAKFPFELVASGGVTTIGDLLALKELGLSGAIVGKAYYEGRIDLREAIEVTK